MSSGKTENPAKNLTRKRIILVIIIICTLTVIWGHSFMSGEQSGAESSFIFKILQPFLDFFAGEGNSTELFVRKAAHFTEFFVLGTEFFLLMLLTIGRKKTEKPQRLPVMMVNAWALGTLCALTDETIQLFSSGRGSAVSDVWLDSAGCLCSVLLGSLVYILKRRRKQSAES